MTIIHKPTSPGEHRTDVQKELAAMQTVANTLEGLPDASGRARVLRWVAERFASDINTPAPAVTEPVARMLTFGAHVKPNDPMLELVGIERLFEPDPDLHVATAAARTATPLNAEEQAALSIVHGLIEHFRKLATEWEERARHRSEE